VPADEARQVFQKTMGSMIFSGTTTRFMLIRSIRRTWFTIVKKFRWLETTVDAVEKLTRTTKS
jgi:hypothetical protein